MLDLDHADMPATAPSTFRARDRRSGKLARQYNVFIIAQAKASHPDWKDRFFNVGFILDPDGEVILKHYKLSPLFPVERWSGRTTSLTGGSRSTAAS